MSVAATLKPFTSRTPTMVVLQTSDHFDGAAQTGTPVVSKGIVTYPAQTGGGLFKLHDKPIKILEAYQVGTGTLVITKKINETSTINVTIASISDLKDMTLLPGEWLTFATSGTAVNKMVIKAQELPIAVGA